MAARIALHNGTPTCFLDGKPTFLGYMWCRGPGLDGWEATEAAGLYAEAGIHIYAFDCGSTGAPESEWCGPGQGRDSHFDFSTVADRFGRVLEVDPEARFHLRVHLEQRRGHGWWLDLYPEECELDSAGGRQSQSFASAVWRQQSMEFLRAFAEHLGAVGLGDRVIAYQTGAGDTGEWVKGGTSMGRTCGDYGKPMRHHFRTWLRDRYDGCEGRLRQSWNDDAVTFETAEVPSEADQISTQHFTFRDPRCEQAVIDYFRCLAELCGGLVVDFCRTVKVATDNQALAGVFFGYLTELAWNESFFGSGTQSECGTTARSGHAGLGKVLRSPHVDFLVSPYSYGFRGVGGHGPGMLPTESVRRHGKIYLFEDDSRVHVDFYGGGFGRAATPEDSMAVLRRNLAECLCRGHAIWWLRGSGREPHIDPAVEPAFAPELARLRQLGDFGLHLRSGPGSRDRGFAG